MSRDKNKKLNIYPSRKWNKKKLIIFGILLLFLISGAVLFVKNKIEQKNIQLAQTEIPEDMPEEFPGWWLRDNFGDSICDEADCLPGSDPDQDKLTNAQEFYYHSNPLKEDSNNNGDTDGEDVAAGFDPSRAGKVTFDEAASEDNILGESLVFDKDVIRTVGEMASLNNISVPQISDEEIIISQENTKESILNYLHSSDELMQKHFTQNIGAYLEQSIIEGSTYDLELIKLASVKAKAEFKQLTVPSDAVNIHKSQLGMLELIPMIIYLPSPESMEDVNNSQTDQWYDSVRSFSYLWQQISIETVKLQNKYAQN